MWGIGLGARDPAHTVREGTAVPWGGIKHLLRAGQEVKCPFPAGPGLLPTALSLCPRWEMEGAELENRLLFLLSVHQGKGSPSIAGAKTRLGKQTESRPVQVPPGPLLGWKVEEKVSPGPRTLENSRLRSRNLQLLLRLRGLAAQPYPWVMLSRRWAPQCPNLGARRGSDRLRVLPRSARAARHELRSPTLGRTSQDVRQPPMPSRAFVLAGGNGRTAEENSYRGEQAKFLR